MDVLSKKDRKLLNRLHIPQAQKLLLEKYWIAHPERKTGFSLVSSLLWLLRPAIVAALVSPYFFSGTKPFVNIAIVLIWLLNFLGMALLVIFAIVISVFVSQKKDNAMDRIWAKFLPGATGPLAKIYSAVIWIAVFGLAASEGYFFTSGMVAIGLFIIWFLGKFCREGVKSFLEVRLAETSPDSLVRTIPGQIA